MKPNALITVDFYRRWKWAYLLGGLLLSMLAFALTWWHKTDYFPVAFGAMLGAVLLSFDLNMRGAARPLLTLPVSLKEHSATLWWIAIFLPALFVTLCFAIGSSVALLWGKTPAWGPNQWLLFFLLNLSFNGMMYYLLTLMMINPPNNFLEQLKGMATGALWGLSISLGLNSQFLFPDGWQNLGMRVITLLAVGLVCCIWTWNRGGVMLCNRSRKLEKGVSIRPSKNTFSPYGEMTGLPLLFTRIFVQAFIFGFIGLTSMLFMLFFMKGVAPHHANGGKLPGMEMTIFFLPIIGMTLLTPVAGNVRHFRSLPIGVNHLALLYTLLPLITLVGMSIPIAVCFQLLGNLLNLPRLATYSILLAGLYSLYLSFTLRLGAKHMLWAVAVIFPVGFLLFTFPQKTDGKTSVLFPICLNVIGLVLIGITYWWNINTLKHGRRTYQASSFQMVTPRMS